LGERIRGRVRAGRSVAQIGHHGYAINAVDALLPPVGTAE
jgi:hypothetical protein